MASTSVLSRTRRVLAVYAHHAWCYKGEVSSAPMLGHRSRASRFLGLLLLAWLGVSNIASAQEADASSRVQVAPILETGCRPGDCPQREDPLPSHQTPSRLDARKAPPASAETRPPPGSILRSTADGDLQVIAPRPRLPRLWPPIVLTCIGATLLVPAVTLLTISAIDPEERSESEYGTREGLAQLALAGGLVGGGLWWLHRRKEKRRRIREEFESRQLSWVLTGAGARFDLRF